MKNLAAISAILVVTAALAGLALWLLRRTEENGKRGSRCLVVFLFTWLTALALGAVGARFGYERQYQALPGFWAVYLPAVALAFGVAVPLAWWLGRAPKPKTIPVPKAKPLPKAKAPREPQPEPTKPPAEETVLNFLPPPEPEVTTFKFACPHCGQRLAVTTADVGNSADCPNCQAPLVVPAPPSAVEAR